MSPNASQTTRRTVGTGLFLLVLGGLITGGILMIHHNSMNSSAKTPPDPHCLAKSGKAVLLIRGMQESAQLEPKKTTLNELKASAIATNADLSILLVEDFQLFLNPETAIWSADPAGNREVLGILKTPDSGTVCRLFLADGHQEEIPFADALSRHKNFVEIHQLQAAPKTQ